jgi:hypothetical protein
MKFKVKGILDFSPVNKTKKHSRQSSWKSVAMIKTDCDIDAYYAWFLKKRFNLELNRNLRGTHITFINDRMSLDKFEQVSSLFNGKEVDFYVETEPRSNGEHWWLRVYCTESESIRELMGLNKHPYFGLHLTLGHAVIKYPESVMLSDNSSEKVKKDYLEHSKYIYSCCKDFEMLDTSPRILDL